MLLNGPVVALVKADQGFMFYGEGVYGCSSTLASELNHAVSVIGYDASGNFLIKNSWGANWGVNGFMNLSKDHDCGLKYYVFQYINNDKTLVAAPSDPDPLNVTNNNSTNNSTDNSNDANTNNTNTNNNTNGNNNTSINNNTSNNTSPNNSSNNSSKIAARLLCNSLVLVLVALLAILL